MRHRRILALHSFLTVILTRPCRAQQVVVRPQERDDILANPGVGWENFRRSSKQDKNLPSWIPTTIYYARWGWSELEPLPGKLNTGLLDKALKEARDSGPKLAFRAMCCSTSKGRPYPISEVQIVH